MSGKILKGGKKERRVEIEIYGEPEKHYEAKLYKADHNLADFYLKNDFHQYRLSLLENFIRQIVEKSQKKVVMVNLGCGSGELETRLADLKNLYKIGIDVSKEAMKKGIEKSLFDRAIAVDMTEETFKNIGLPKSVDIVVAAEVLEHIQHPGIFIREKINPLQREGAYLIGSVPNMSQLHDVVGLLTGGSYSYQTSRPLTDITSGHISFFSLESLKKTLLFGGYGQIEIAGNGVRLQRQGDFGFKFLSKVPFLLQFSDRFVFSCRKIGQNYH